MRARPFTRVRFRARKGRDARVVTVCPPPRGRRDAGRPGFPWPGAVWPLALPPRRTRDPKHRLRRDACPLCRRKVAPFVFPPPLASAVGERSRGHRASSGRGRAGGREPAHPAAVRWSSGRVGSAAASAAGTISSPPFGRLRRLVVGWSSVLARPKPGLLRSAPGVQQRGLESFFRSR